MGKSGNPAKRAQLEAVTETDETTDQADTGTEDFDAFWQTRQRKRRTTRIMGEEVELPPALPLQFELEARKLQRSRKDKDVRHLVGILFGEGQLDRWTKAGMDFEQFTVLLAWAPQVIGGADVTLAEVADQIAAMDTDKDPDADPR